MSKRLIICCDGTWNTPDQLDNGQPAPTNVTRLALAASTRDQDGVEQRVFYHPGVGTRRGERLRGGAFGFGLSHDVRDTYRFIVENFEPGDQLFLFGFSRGAFTARSTAGFIRNCGVLRREHADHLDEAYALYRGRRAHPRGVEATLFRRSYSNETRIHFIGVWDTVGALGVPLSGARFLNILNRGSQFHDTELSSTVDAAFQALAIDERRKAFRPAVWKPKPDAEQHVEQVWFAGVHCDVGGGYADHALADIPLLWVVDKAVDRGLSVDRNLLLAGPFAGQDGAERGAVRPDALGRAHESRTGFYRAIRAYPRPIDRDVVRCESASSSAVRRRDEKPGYAPGNLTDYLDGDHRVTDV